MRLRRTPPAAVMFVLGPRRGCNLLVPRNLVLAERTRGTTFLFQRDQGVQQLFRPIGIFWQVVCYIG